MIRSFAWIYIYRTKNEKKDSKKGSEQSLKRNLHQLMGKDYLFFYSANTLFIKNMASPLFI